MQSFIVLASLVSELAGQNVVLNVTKKPLVLLGLKEKYKAVLEKHASIMIKYVIFHRNLVFLLKWPLK